MTAVPLRILVLHHPASKDAKELALDVFRRFSASLGGAGLRIPVAFAPVRDDAMPPALADLGLERATRTLFVFLADARMALRATAADSRASLAWGALAAELVARFVDVESPHGLLPVAVDGRAFGVSKQIQNNSFVRLDRFDNEPARKPAYLAFHVAATALSLLRDESLPLEPTTKAPITIFVSHAKADLPRESLTEGPVHEIVNYLAHEPVEGWYDAKKIPRGARFDKALRDAVSKCHVLLAVLTDHWSDREWCRREVLMAKELARPVIVVVALSADVPRLFPYLGNARVISWREGRSEAVVLATLEEALRQEHARAVLTARSNSDDHVLSVPPEALTVRRLLGTLTRIVYPDPPLPKEELQALAPVLVLGNTETELSPRPVTLTTPLSELARWPRPQEPPLIGLSLSEATDIDRWGASDEHLSALVDDLVIMLLLAGTRLAYGGLLDYRRAKPSEINYTTRLFGLVRSYSPLADSLHETTIHPIAHYVQWPIHLGYGAKELELYGQEAELVATPAPPLDQAQLDALRPDANGYFKPDDASRRWAYACATSVMRRAMAAALDARIAVGGKLAGYGGLLPGVVEEILLGRGSPLFLIGACGGAARYAIDVLEGRPRVESTTAWVSAQFPDYAQRRAEYESRNLSAPTPEQAADQLRDLGKNGPAQGLANGLDDAENRELFVSTDVYRIVELVLTGLGRRYAKT